MLLLAIDIGTSSCKLALFREDGTPAGSVTRGYPLYTPAPGCVEQDADSWWDAVCGGCRELLAQPGIRAEQIAAIGIDGQSWAAIPVDAEGNVLRRTPIWMDTRAKEVCARYEARIGAERIFQTAGNPFSPSYTLPKILYFMEHEPELVRRTRAFLQSNSFIDYRLTGVISQDLSQSYGYHNFDQHTLQYDDALTQAFGLERRFLLDMVPSQQVIGHVTEAAAACTGLLAGTPVVAGGLDAACSTLGVGVTQPGQAQEQGGQAGGMSICMDRACAHPALILSPHVVGGRWLLQGGTVAGGASLNWFAQQFPPQNETQGVFRRLSEEASAAPLGANGLLFLPYLNGERSPIWNPEACGLFFGASLSTTHADFVRATMEGVAYSLQHNLLCAGQAGAQVGELRATGGSAASEIWCQIKADVTGVSLLVPDSDSSAVTGAAILAGLGVGMFASEEAAVSAFVRTRRRHTPEPEAHETYRQGFSLYRKLYEANKELMAERSAYARMLHTYNEKERMQQR